MLKEISKKFRIFLGSAYFLHHRFQLLSVGIFAILGILGTGMYFFSSSCNQKTSGVSTSPTPSVSPTNYPKIERYRVPILMYHYIRPSDPSNRLVDRLSVSPENFESQVGWLKENHFATIKTADLSDSNKTVISNTYGRGEKPLIITFDDGYADAFLTAYPILRKHNFSGTFYIIRNAVGKPNYLTQAQIEELQSAGMEIGAHALDHLDLTKMTLAEARRQIADSKSDAQSFSFPAGKFNEAIKGLVKESMYTNAITTEEGVADQNSDLFELPRIRISNLTLDQFKNRVGE